MFKKSLLLASAILLSQFAHAQFGKILDKAKDKVGLDVPLSQEEAGNGLKEALNNGIGEAVNFLSAKDGYFKSPYKILLPEEAQKVVTRLKVVPGFSNVEADLTERPLVEVRRCLSEVPGAFPEKLVAVPLQCVPGEPVPGPVRTWSSQAVPSSLRS